MKAPLLLSMDSYPPLCALSLYGHLHTKNFFICSSRTTWVWCGCSSISIWDMGFNIVHRCCVIGLNSLYKAVTIALVLLISNRETMMPSDPCTILFLIYHTSNPYFQARRVTLPVHIYLFCLHLHYHCCLLIAPTL